MIELNIWLNGVASFLGHPFVLVWLGLVTHFVKAFAEIKKHAGLTITPWGYYVKNPWHSVLAVIGALVGYVLLIGVVDVTELPAEAANAIRINAFFVGYMADSVIDLLGQRSTVAKPKEV